MCGALPRLQALFVGSQEPAHLSTVTCQATAHFQIQAHSIAAALGPGPCRPNSHRVRSLVPSLESWRLSTHPSSGCSVAPRPIRPGLLGGRRRCRTPGSQQQRPARVPACAHACSRMYACSVCTSFHVCEVLRVCASVCAHTPVSRGLPLVPKEHTCEIWGQRDHLGLGALAGGLGQAEAKDPVNSCDPLGSGEGVFFLSEERSEGNSQFGIVLEKNMNYLSVTSRLAWRGHAWRGAEAQTARQGSKSGQRPRSRTPRAVSRRPHPAP